MFPFQRDFFIARINSGYIRFKYKDKAYKYQLNRDSIYESEEVFNEVYQDCLNSNVLTEESVYPILLERNLWNDEEEERLTKKIPDFMDNVKVEMYNSINAPDEVDRKRQFLNRVRKEFQLIFGIRHQFDYLTCYGTALFARWHFLIKECVFNIDGSKVDWDNISSYEILNIVNNSEIEDSIIRNIARNEPWRDVWLIGKTHNVFDRSPADYTDEQLRLIRWSIHYDNIQEHENPPPKEVIDDDDCLDGWMILNRRNADKEKGLDSINRIANKHRGANELFIPVKNKYSSEYIMSNGIIGLTGEDADKIFSANNSMARGIIQSRINAIQENGPMKFADLPDVKMQINMELTRMGQ